MKPAKNPRSASRLFGLRFLILIAVSAIACDETSISKPAISLPTTMDQPNNLEIPSPVNEFVLAVNKGDKATFLAFFDENNSLINDWGRKYVGHAAIGEWSDREFIGAKGTITPQRVVVNGKSITLWAGWKSNSYSGDSKFVFIVNGSNIEEMRIESAK